MDTKTQALLEARARILKAMAHPTRLFILEALAQEKLCVAELTASIGADISTVSKHLSVLKNAGVVSDEKKGLKVFYHLRMPCLNKLLSCVEAEAMKHLKQQLKQI